MNKPDPFYNLIYMTRDDVQKILNDKDIMNITFEIYNSINNGMYLFIILNCYTTIKELTYGFMRNETRDSINEFLPTLQFKDAKYPSFYYRFEDFDNDILLNIDYLFNNKNSEALISILSVFTYEGLEELDEFLRNILNKEDLEYYENCLELIKLKQITGA